jgi:hypothetical protein
MEWQAITSPGRFRGEHTGIHSPSHAEQELFWNSGSVALDFISRHHAISRHDIALPPRGFFIQQGNVCTPSRVMLNPFDRVDPWSHPVEVHGPYPPFVATTSVPHYNSAAVVPPSFSMASLRNCQWEKRPALP